MGGERRPALLAALAGVLVMALVVVLVGAGPIGAGALAALPR
jgi:hypothetical protein